MGPFVPSGLFLANTHVPKRIIRQKCRTPVTIVTIVTGYMFVLELFNHDSFEAIEFGCAASIEGPNDGTVSALFVSLNG